MSTSVFGDYPGTDRAGSAGAYRQRLTGAQIASAYRHRHQAGGQHRGHHLPGGCGAGSARFYPVAAGCDGDWCRGHLCDGEQTYGETNARGKYSGREYNTNKAGGPIQNLDWKGASIDRAGVDKVKLHTGRFTESDANKVMIGRLEKILKENCLPPILTGDFIHMRSGNWSVIAIWVLEMARCQIIKGSVE